MSPKPSQPDRLWKNEDTYRLAVLPRDLWLVVARIQALDREKRIRRMRGMATG